METTLTLIQNFDKVSVTNLNTVFTRWLYVLQTFYIEGYGHPLST